MVAVAPLAVFVAALFALLFILAWQQWGQVILNTLNVSIPVVGNVIASAVGDALNAAYAGAVLWLDNVVKPLADYILGLLAPVENLVGGLVTYADQNTALLVQYFTVGLPAEAQTIANQLHQVASDGVYTGINTIDPGIEDVLNIVGALGTEVSVQLSTLRNYVDYYYGLLQSDIANLSGTVVVAAGVTADQVNSLVAGAESKVEADIQTAYNAATSYAQSLAEALQTDIAQEATNVTALATAAATAAGQALITDLDTAIAGTLGAIWTNVDSAVVDLVGVIGADDPDILSAIRGITTDVPSDIAGVAALAGTTALALTRYLKDCGIPNCKNLSGFGNDLQSLLGLVGDASFLTLIIDLAKQPSDASTIVTGLFGMVLTDTTTAFRDLVGV